MTESNSNRYMVSQEDAQRLDRLSEEIRGRLTEMALIMARVSGSEYSGGAVTKFVPRKAVQTHELVASSDWIEIVEIVPGYNCCYGSVGGQTVLNCPC